jgi:hypothetical protein
MLIVDTVSTCEFKSEVTYWQSAAAQDFTKKKKKIHLAHVLYLTTRRCFCHGSRILNVSLSVQYKTSGTVLVELLRSTVLHAIASIVAGWLPSPRLLVVEREKLLQELSTSSCLTGSRSLSEQGAARGGSARCVSSVVCAVKRVEKIDNKKCYFFTCVVWDCRTIYEVATC